MRAQYLIVLTACGRVGFTSADATRDDGHGDDDGMLADAGPRPNLAFVTSDEMPITAIGGVSGANAICQQRAVDANLTGTFVGFVWGTGLDPAVALAGSRGWVDFYGRPLVDAPSTWSVNANVRGMLAPLIYDEHGDAHPSDAAWTGDGAATCTDWSGTVGNVRILPLAEPFHSSNLSTPCNSTQRLVCLEVGRSVAVAVTPGAGRIIFTSRSNFINDGGLAGADALCASEATAAALPGSYLAFMGTSVATPESRFVATNDPVVRVDGVRFAPSMTELLIGTSASFETFLDLAADGDWQQFSTAIGIGGTCNDWSTTSNAVLQGYGDPLTTTRAKFRSKGTSPCNSVGKLVCLQSQN